MKNPLITGKNNQTKPAENTGEKPSEHIHLMEFSGSLPLGRKWGGHSYAGKK